MPAKQQTGKVSNVGTKRRRRQRVEALRALPASSAYPNMSRIVMVYPTKIAITEAAAGTGAFYFYSLNNVFDPDVSGVGGNTLGYGNWSAVFANYKVRRATVRLECGVTGITTSAVAQVSLIPVPRQAVLPSNPMVWACRPGAKTKELPVLTSGGRTAKLVASWPISKVLEVTPQQYENDMDFSGAAGSSPARQAMVAVTLNVSGSTTAGTLNGFVYVSYEVEWFNPIPLQ